MRLGNGGRNATSQSAKPVVDRRAECGRGYQHNDGNRGDQEAVLDDVLAVLLLGELLEKFHVYLLTLRTGPLAHIPAGWGLPPCRQLMRRVLVAPGCVMLASGSPPAQSTASRKSDANLARTPPRHAPLPSGW